MSVWILKSLIFYIGKAACCITKRTTEMMWVHIKKFPAIPREADDTTAQGDRDFALNTMSKQSAH